MAKTNPGEFVREVRQEVAKVTWPTRKETMVTTAMVFVMVFLLMIFFFFVDQILSWGVRLILGIGVQAEMEARWYIVHTYSGFEKKVAQALREQADRNMPELFENILVPTEEVVEMRRGQKISSERKFFPGYVLIKMVMTNESWHLVKNTSKVTGFLGTAGEPAPITQAEADRILQKVK